MSLTAGYMIVQDLPEAGENGTIYLCRNEEGFEEYMYNGGS